MSSPSLTAEWKAPLHAADKAARGRQRIRRANLTAVVSIGFRGAMLLSSFLYTPATIHYLGPERYGLWVAMTSIITLLAFADCGLGFSLMNDVACSIGRGMSDSVRRSISTTFFVLAAIGGLACLVFGVTYALIPWQSLFRTRTPVQTVEVARAVAVIVYAFLLTLPFTTVQRVQSAHQEGFKTQAWEIGGIAFSLVGLLIAIRLHSGLPVLAIVFTSGPLLATIANWTVYFLFRHRTELPVFRLCDAGLAVRIAREGGYFLILQIAGAAIFSVDSFIVLHYFGQEAFANYSLVSKLFQVAPALAAAWFAALWPAYAEAVARGDHDWVRRTLLVSTLASAAGCAAASCGAAILARPLIHIWTGMVVEPSTHLLVGWVAYWAIVTGTNAIAMYLNGSRFLKVQSFLAILIAGSSALLKILLCKYWDISGAVWATVIVYVLLALPAYCAVARQLMHEQKNGCVQIPTVV